MSSLNQLNELVTDYNKRCIELEEARRNTEVARFKLMHCCDQLKGVVVANNIKLQLIGGVVRNGIPT